MVVDGRDEVTIDTLNRIGDDRLKVLVPTRRLGNAAARNFGIDAACGAWIALLDDDDRWLPKKLALQLSAAERSRYRLPIISCRLNARSETQSFVWPRRYPDVDQPLSEYLFCRRRPTTGEGLVQTSTVMAPTELFRRVPFQAGLRRYVDLDWLLRADVLDEVGIEFVPAREPLVVWRIEAKRGRVTNQAGWRWDLAWIRRRRSLVTPRAYAAFLLTLASTRAARDRSRSGLLVLLREALRVGRPGWAEIVYHAGNFGLSTAMRARLAAALAHRTPRRLPRHEAVAEPGRGLRTYPRTGV